MRDKVDDSGFLLQRELELALQQRHPDRFVPHYTMVSFMRIPDSVAQHRSELQRALLVRHTAGRDRLDQVDWTAVDADVASTLVPLEDAAT